MLMADFVASMLMDSTPALENDLETFARHDGEGGASNFVASTDSPSTVDYRDPPQEEEEEAFDGDDGDDGLAGEEWSLSILRGATPVDHPAQSSSKPSAAAHSPLPTAYRLGIG